MNRVLRVFLGVLVLLVATSDAWAQATAQINGTVADSSGGVLPGVTVTAIQTETGFRREVVTDETGSYSLLNLPVGPYRIEATLSGFRTFSHERSVMRQGRIGLLNHVYPPYGPKVRRILGVINRLFG